VILYDYLKTDVYTPATDSVTVSDALVKTVTLPLTGGPHVRAFMGSSGDYLTSERAPATALSCRCTPAR